MTKYHVHIPVQRIEAKGEPTCRRDDRTIRLTVEAPSPGLAVGAIQAALQETLDAAMGVGDDE